MRTVTSNCIGYFELERPAPLATSTDGYGHWHWFATDAERDEQLKDFKKGWSECERGELEDFGDNLDL